MPSPRLEPFQQIAQFVSEQRKRFADELVEGRWNGEVQGKVLAARIAMCDEIYEQMRSVAGHNSHFGERDVE